MSSSLSNGNANNATIVAKDDVIDLNRGDPTMYEKYWQKKGDEATVVIPGWQSMSYFSDVKNSICWFLEPEFSKEIVRLHKTVGNAVTENRYIIVGTGSTQLYQAALYALSPHDVVDSIPVVAATPFYSSYPTITDCVKSGLYKWEGDSQSFKKEGPYIELITSPNNPDGFIRHPTVNGNDGLLIHDFAYYWPQYTPITSAVDHDIMLFTLSKITGHAGMRLGWAIVKDIEVAKKMTEYITLNTIGVCRDSQLRASKVLKVVSDSCNQSQDQGESFFDYGYQLMAKRWNLIRELIKKNNTFSLPNYPPEFCQFNDRNVEPQPPYAWLKCEGEIADCEKFLRENNILTRGGKSFGCSEKFTRISLLEKDERYAKFIERMSKILASDS